MKIKYLILLNIIMAGISNWNINCSEQNQEKKLTKEEQEILDLFNPMKSAWLNIMVKNDAFTERLEQVKLYASKGGDLSIIIEEAIMRPHDTNLIKFLLGDKNVSGLFYKYIEPENNEIGSLKYHLSTWLNINSEEYIKIRETFNLISYNKYLKESDEIKNVQLYLQNKILLPELVRIIVDYYIMYYEEFCNQNQVLINLWRDQFQQKILNKRNLDNNKPSLRCKRCIIQ